MQARFLMKPVMMLTVCLALAGCSPQSGLELLERTAANTGEA